MASAESSDTLPPVRGLIRGKSGIRAIRLTGGVPLIETVTEIPAYEDAHARSTYSADGRFLAVQTLENVLVFEIDPVSGEPNQIQEISQPGALGLSFSPSGATLMTWSRHLPKSNEPNLLAWNVDTAENIAGWVSRESPRDMWPQVFWSADEVICARTRTNEVQVNSTQPAIAPDERIRVENITKCSIAPGRAPYSIVTFSPPTKALPAFVKLFTFADLEAVTLDMVPVAQSSFFRVETCEFLWQPNGKSVIAKAECASDAQNKSYYGECQLYYIQADGKKTHQIGLDKEGPVHDIKWAPAGAGFIVIYGFMPGKCTLFEGGRPKFEFGNMAVNEALWSPHARFVALAGFGALNGDIQFWDMNKMKKIGEANSRYAVEASWSPDSRHFTTAVTAPRRRTDFCFKVFSYHGVLEHEEECEELYQMTWAPAARGTYPDRAATPNRAGGVNQTIVAKSSAGAYVPPSARGKGGEQTASKIREMMEADRGTGASAVGPRKVANDPSAPLSKQAIKNQKKREAKKRAAEEKDAAPEAIPEAAAPEAAPVVVEAAAPDVPDPEVVKQKQLRNIQKKLRQITDLKDKQAAGAELNPAQLDKLKTEGALLQDLEALMR